MKIVSKDATNEVAAGAQASALGSVGFVLAGVTAISALFSSLKRDRVRPEPRVPSMSELGEVFPVVAGVRRISPVTVFSQSRLSSDRLDIVHVLATGPIDSLTKVYIDNNKTSLSFKPMFRTSNRPEDGTNFQEVEGIGRFHVFWGEEDQPANGLLGDSSRIGVVSSWPHICYVVWEDIKSSSVDVSGFEYEIVSSPESQLETTPAYYRPRSKTVTLIKDATVALTRNNVEVVFSGYDPLSDYYEQPQSDEWAEIIFTGVMGIGIAGVFGGPIVDTFFTDPDPSIETDIIIIEDVYHRKLGFKNSGQRDGTLNALLHVSYNNTVYDIFMAVPNYSGLHTDFILKNKDTDLPPNGALVDINADLNVDGANAAHVLYQLLFSTPPKGAGLDTTYFDLDSLETVSQFMASEGSTASITTLDYSVAEMIIKIMQEHLITIYLHPTTGLFTFSYSLSKKDVPTISKNKITEIRMSKILKVNDRISSDLCVKYVDRHRAFNESSFCIHEDGKVLNKEVESSQTVELDTVVDIFSAARLGTLNQALFQDSVKTVELDVSHEARYLQPGDPFKIEGDPLEYRVRSIRFSPDTGKARIRAVSNQLGLISKEVRDLYVPDFIVV